jgi:hypothetical protein
MLKEQKGGPQCNYLNPLGHNVSMMRKSLYKMCNILKSLDLHNISQVKR